MFTKRNRYRSTTRIAKFESAREEFGDLVKLVLTTLRKRLDMNVPASEPNEMEVFFDSRDKAMWGVSSDYVKQVITITIIYFDDKEVIKLRNEREVINFLDEVR